MTGATASSELFRRLDGLYTASNLVGSANPPAAAGVEGAGMPDKINLGASASFPRSINQSINQPMFQKELFLRDAFWLLKDGIIPPTQRSGQAQSDFGKRSRKLVKQTKSTPRYFWDGVREVLAKQPDFRRNFLRKDESFRAVDGLYKGEGHYPGSREIPG